MKGNQKKVMDKISKKMSCYGNHKKTRKFTQKKRFCNKNDHTPELMQITNRRGREFMKLNVGIDYNAKDS